jgi:prolyl-tRNA editing enzyme YbaK/EbsC (Cys-tRNA(Pro) deacylase)
VRVALVACGLPDPSIKEFDASTATAQHAAEAIGTSVERIVKSLVFMASAQPILVLASGPNRVDTHKVAQLVGQAITRANADQVRAFTGFAIGGVPPLGHATPLQTLIDRDLLQFDEVWAAAGTPNAVFPIDPRRLVEVTGGRVEDVVESK